MFLTAWVSPDIWSPLTNAAINASCDKAWFGWSCDEQIEKLRDQFAREVDPVKKKQMADQIQTRAFEIGTHAPLGEFINPAAVRKGVKGLVIGPGNFYWNISKQ